jgi:gas vesicle protein
MLSLPGFAFLARFLDFYRSLLLTYKTIAMSVQKVLVGTLSGLVAGVAIGLLVAPAPGDETRQKIADTADNIKKKLRRLRGSAGDELDELREIFETEVDGIKEDVRERVLKLIESSKNSYQNVKNHVKEDSAGI